MAFVTAKYFVKFRHSDTGLTPTFTMFKKESDLSTLSSPTIGEVGQGIYSFSYMWDSIRDSGIICVVDGGASLPTDNRYSTFSISPKDYEHLDVADKMDRVLGLLHENAVIDQTTISNGHITSARIRIYDSAANALSPGLTGLVASYTLTASYSDTGLLTSVTTKN